MRQKLQRTLIGALLLSTLSLSAAPVKVSTFPGKETAPLSRMRKSVPAQRWAGINNGGIKQQRVAPKFTTPASNEFQYLIGPDGSQWCAICIYDTEEIPLEGGVATQLLIKGFTYTIYDNNFNEIGKVRDKIELEEGETRCAAVSLDVTVTQKFFKNDSNYEVMVSMSFNTPDYVTHTRTKIYPVRNLEEGEYSSLINVIQGYPIDAVNCAKDQWTEDYYITFLTEKTPDLDKEYPEYIDFLAEYKYVLTTYKKGGYNSDPQILFEHEIRMLDLPGDQMTSPMMLCKNVNSKLTLIYAQYEKSFYVDPSGMSGNEAITPDNSLIIDVYQMNDNYPSEIELINSTKIKTTPNSDNPNVYYTYYGIGNLTYDNDVDFEGHYAADNRPTFVVTVDEYLLSDDDHYNSSYYVYDADGNKIKTIAENTFDFVMMSDLPGHEPQAMFIHTGDEMSFKFVDLYSCNQVMEVDQMYRGYGLSTSFDRVPTANGYAYASALSAGIPIDDDTLAAPVIWLDTDGEMIRLDKIPTGKNIELAQIYISSHALSPYIFNTDKELEYMLLVKRKVGSQTALQEELLIASPESGIIHAFTPDKEKGYIWRVYLTDDTDPELIIVYANDNKFITDAYELPFSKFGGGEGSAENPYLIATAGDLQQIKSAPSASYKIVADIDFGGVAFNPINEFKGTLDGCGHVISNLDMLSGDNSGLFRYCEGATIKNIDFYDCTLSLRGDNEAALVALTSSKSTFDNIHIRRLNVSGENFYGCYGSIVGKMWTYSNIIGCEVTGAEINLPSGSCTGGIVGDIRTGSNITSCAFSGNMATDNTLGGIVGSTTTGDEVISFCHVDANLKAQHTIGGIVGFLNRSKVKSNYVEGAIAATSASKWTNAISAGGVAGELEGDWQGKGDVPVVNNLIGVTSIDYPELTIAEKYPHQLATVHRIVGRSSYNAEPKAEYDDEGNFIKYTDEIIYEQGILNNIVVSDLAVIDEDFSEKTLEGKSVDKFEIDTDMLQESLGFKFGTSSDAPWNIQSWNAYDPSLYYESMIYIPTPEITVAKGKLFNIDIAVLSREELTAEDLMDSFMCEFDEEMLEMTGNMSYDGRTMSVEFNPLRTGEAPFTVSILNGKAACNVKVVDAGSSAESIIADSESLMYREGLIIASGCSITVHDINGRLMLAGGNSVDTKSLESGVYLATAVNKDGTRKTLKFLK